MFLSTTKADKDIELAGSSLSVYGLNTLQIVENVDYKLGFRQLVIQTAHAIELLKQCSLNCMNWLYVCHLEVTL